MFLEFSHLREVQNDAQIYPAIFPLALISQVEVLVVIVVTEIELDLKLGSLLYLLNGHILKI